MREFTDRPDCRNSLFDFLKTFVFCKKAIGTWGGGRNRSIFFPYTIQSVRRSCLSGGENKPVCCPLLALVYPATGYIPGRPVFLSRFRYLLLQGQCDECPHLSYQ